MKKEKGYGICIYLLQSLNFLLQTIPTSLIPYLFLEYKHDFFLDGVKTYNFTELDLGCISTHLIVT